MKKETHKIIHVRFLISRNKIILVLDGQDSDGFKLFIFFTGCKDTAKLSIVF